MWRQNFTPWGSLALICRSAQRWCPARWANFPFQNLPNNSSPPDSLMKGEGFFPNKDCSSIVYILFCKNAHVHHVFVFATAFMACITFTALTGWPLSCFHNNQLLWFLLSSCLVHCLCNRNINQHVRDHCTTPTKIQKIRGLEFSLPRRSRISSFSTDLNFRMTSTARLLPRRRGIVESSEPWRDKDAWKKMLQKIASPTQKRAGY